MCGISGIVSKKIFNPSDLKSINDLIVHRGPDDYGFSLWNVDIKKKKNTIVKKNNFQNYIGFGHRRLSILDLSTNGRQPMSFNDFTIIFNGEIYNYLEIREELKHQGHKFDTQTDTEVLLKSYMQWGDECLNKFNGMFSFLIYDENNNTIFGARDRFGVKPLYYYLSQDKKTVIFASEIKQIALSVFYQEKNANKQMIYDYLFFTKSDHTNETMFENIFQIRGGENFHLNLNNDTYQIKSKLWYNLQDKVAREKNNSLTNIKKNFSNSFFDSIRLRLRSDVSVGSCLSGGMDSSSIVGSTAKKFYKKLDTFSIIFPKTIYNEEKFIDSLVNKYQLNNIKKTPSTSNLLNEIEKVVYYQDEPIRSFSQYSQYSLFELVSQNDKKVVLNGQGGDEILGGYPSYLFSAINENKFDIGGLKKYLSILKKEGSLSFIQKLVYFNELIFKKINLIDKLRRSSFLNKAYNYKYFKKLDLDKNKKYFSNTFLQHSIDQILKDFLPQMLHYEDRNSMAFSIESRLPFLDYRLVEKTLEIPMKYKVDIKQKFILKEVMGDIVPNDIINRTDKKGFATPLTEWLQYLEQYIIDFDTQNSELFKDIDFKKLFKKKKNKEKFFLHTFKIAQIMMWSKIFNIKI